MADRLYTTRETDEILSALRLETKLEKYILARIAFSLSLTEDGINVPISKDFSGAEMKRPTFIGQDELFIKTLICDVYKKPDIDEESFYSNKSIIKNHIDSGAQKIKLLFEESGNNADLMIKKLIDRVEFKGHTTCFADGRLDDVRDLAQVDMSRYDLAIRIGHSDKGLAHVLAGDTAGMQQGAVGSTLRSALDFVTVHLDLHDAASGHGKQRSPVLLKYTFGERCPVHHVRANAPREIVAYIFGHPARSAHHVEPVAH